MSSITIKQEYINACRICLKHDPTDRHTIFDELTEAADERFSQIHYFLMSFTDIKVEKDDGLPNRICNDCLLLIKSAYKLYKLCNESQKHFITLSESSVVNLEETENVLLSDLVPLNNLNTELLANSYDFNVTKCIIDTTLSNERGSVEFNCNPDEEITSNLQSKSNESNRKPGELETNPEVERPVNIEGKYSTKIIAEQTRFMCNECGRLFSALTDLKQHYVMHLDAFYICKHCQETFSNQYMFKHHLEMHSEERYFCNSCSKSFITKRAFQDHENMHNNIPFECKICDKTFTRAYALRTHQKSHYNDLSNKCSYCGETFKKKGMLVRHEKNHCSFQCDQCGKSFSKPYRLKRHQLTPCNGPRTLACDQCGKSFSNTYKLNRHKLIHMKNVQHIHKCDQCYKSFSNTYKLNRHKLTHMRNASIVLNCDQCNKCFASEEGLQLHKEIWHQCYVQLDKYKQSINVGEKNISVEMDIKIETETISNIKVDEMETINSDETIVTSTESLKLVQLNSDDVLDASTINVNEAETPIQTEIKIESSEIKPEVIEMNTEAQINTSLQIPPITVNDEAMVPTTSVPTDNTESYESNSYNFVKLENCYEYLANNVY